MMTRDRIKSRASFKSEFWAGTEVPWPSPHDAGCEGPGLVFGKESGFRMSVGDTIPSGPPLLSSAAAESPAGSSLPSLDLMTRSGSKAGAVVGAANPWEIKSPRISAT